MKKLTNKSIFKISVLSYFILNIVNRYLLITRKLNKYIVTFKRNPIGEINAFIGDFAILLLVFTIAFIFIKKTKKRILALAIITLLLNIAVFALTIFTKYYGTSFSFYSLTLFLNPAPALAGSIFIESMKEIFLYYRILLFLPAAILFTLYYLYKPEEQADKSPSRILLNLKTQTISLLAVFVLMITNLMIFNVISTKWELNSSRSTFVSQNIGVYSYYVYEMLGENFSVQIKEYYDDEDFLETYQTYNKNQETYTNYIDGKNYSNKLKYEDTNHLVLKNGLQNTNELNGIFEGKNVVLFHLESFNYYLYNQPEIKQYFPFLNFLLSQSYVMDNFYTNAGIGTSSDAEFSVLTGLNALGHSTIYWDFTREYNEELNPYALPKYFKEKEYYAESLHADVDMFYNRRNVHPKMLGFDKYYSINDFIEEGYTNDKYNHPNAWISERALMDKVNNLIKEIDEPYFIYPITMMPHTPFDFDPYDKTDEMIIFNDKWENELSNNTLKYLRFAKYYDEILERIFIDPETGEITTDPDAVYIFYGDHGANIIDEDIKTIFNKDMEPVEYRKIKNQTMAWIYAPGDKELTKTVNGKTMTIKEGNMIGHQPLVRSQIDMYRTIVELFNLNAEDDIYFGVNLLSKEPTYSIDSRVLDVVFDHNTYPLSNPELALYPEIPLTQKLEQYVLERKKINDYLIERNLFDKVSEKQKRGWKSSFYSFTSK